MSLRGRLKEFFGIADVDPETRRSAVQEPGPSWAEWARGSLAKAYLALGFFIADVLLLVTGLQPIDPFVFAGVVLAIYLEILAWQYLSVPPAPGPREPVRHLPPYRLSSRPVRPLDPRRGTGPGRRRPLR